jgi:pSer/pThr/pTyr-binding forkhead associated (FHA) protein
MDSLKKDTVIKNLMCPSCSHLNRQGNRYCSNCGLEFADEEKSAGPCLSVLTSDQSSVVFPVKDGTTTIGRNIENSIVLNDEQVSSNHAAIFTDELKVWIDDLKSRNGVYLNGKRITSQSLLHDGSLIRLGNTILRFEDKRNRS